MRTGTGSRRPRLFWLTLLLAAFAAVGAAEARDSRPEAFGTAATTMVQVPAAQCYVLGGTDASPRHQRVHYSRCPRPAPSSASRTFPPASSSSGSRSVAYDGSDAGAVNINLVRCQSLDPTTSASSGASRRRPGPPPRRSGAARRGHFADPIVVDKTAELTFVRVYLTAGGSDLQFREVDFFYQLQISTPAPGTQTFADVPPSNLYYKGIEAIAASGITGGCGNGNFCPSGYVTRGEIATFFARALGLHFPN